VFATEIGHQKEICCICVLATFFPCYPPPDPQSGRTGLQLRRTAMVRHRLGRRESVSQWYHV